MWAYPVENRAEIDEVEVALFHAFNPKSTLMNGKTPKPRLG